MKPYQGINQDVCAINGKHTQEKDFFIKRKFILIKEKSLGKPGICPGMTGNVLIIILTWNRRISKIIVILT